MNKSITIKTCFGHSQGPASGQNNIHENSRPTHHTQTHSSFGGGKKKKKVNFGTNVTR